MKRTRPVGGMQRRYSWRMYPTADQAAALEEQARMCAALWNALLEICETRTGRAVQRRGRSVSFHCRDCAGLSAGGKLVLCSTHKLPSEFDLSYWISSMLAECPEWRALSTWTPRRIAGSLAAAYRAFFRRAKAGAGRASGYPRYKSVRRASAIPHRCVSGCAIKKSDRHEQSWLVRLKGVPGEVWARGRLPNTVHEMTDADITGRNGRWEISIAVSIDKRRRSCADPSAAIISFDLIDGFARVNGVLDTPSDLMAAQELDHRRAQMQSDFDVRWPRGKRWSDEEWQERCETKAEIARISSRVARVRSNALHVWSKRITERASMLTIIKPAVKQHTASPRGNEHEWGSAVRTVSTLNRNVLSLAPGMAVAMLKYKALEIGIPVQIVEDAKPEIAIGEKLVAAGKSIRNAKRAIERNGYERNRQRTGSPRRGDRRGDGTRERGHGPGGRP